MEMVSLIKGDTLVTLMNGGLIPHSILRPSRRKIQSAPPAQSLCSRSIFTALDVDVCYSESSIRDFF